MNMGAPVERSGPLGAKPGDDPVPGDRYEDHIALDARLDPAKFLGLEEDEEIRRRFDTELTAQNGHLGRWRVELPNAERDELDRRYREILDQMAADGIESRPDPDPLPSDFAAVPAGDAGSTIDPWADGRAEHA